MNRRLFLRSSATLAAGTLLGPEPLLAAGTDDTLKVTLLHTNDTHSRIEPFPDDGRQWGGLGGVARRSRLIKQIRAEEQHVLLLDAGDIFQGTPYFNFFEGEVEFKAMSEMGYDLATIGNHDFDNGIDGLKKMLPHADFPFVTANYDFSRTALKDHFDPYKILERGGIRFGVFGLGVALQGLVPEALFGNTRYQDPLAVSREMVQELQHQQVDMIIALSHLGYQYPGEKVSDRVLAREVEGLDLIIGGHTHTFLNQPVNLKSNYGKEVMVNQVGWAGINLGRIDCYFSRDKRKKRLQGQALTVGRKSSPM